MIMGIAALIFIPLLAVAVAHFIWAFGGTWPIRDRELLIRTAYGRTGMTRMPPKVVTFVVAIMILATGIIALSLADPDAGGIWLTLLGAVVGAVFVARGIIGYTAGWRAMFSLEPFATLDRKQYSPLCLFIGAGFLLLVLLRLL